MRMTKLSALLILALLTACASDPVEISYYTLASPVSETIGVRELTDKPVLVIETVELAAYLRQSGMVIQTGDNQLEVSKRRLWAESLEQSVPKVLFQALQRKSQDYTYYVKFMDFVPRTDYRVRLHIDNLQATDGGQVVTSGRYQIVVDRDQDLSITADFYFALDLQQDGFEHSVDQLRNLVAQIADAVLASTNTLAARQNAAR